MARISNLMDIFLQPGELFVGDANFQIRTILGSCVSITLWHAQLRVGGMSHFLLPTRGAARGSAELDGRYGDEALELMFRDLRAAGANPLVCEAKIFGGGNMFPGNQHARGQQAKGLSVGKRNGEAARKLLRQHGIEVVTESLYGIGHRQIIFDVSKGDVWSRQVRPSSLEIDAESVEQGM
ncbi:MAG TPA: chemotaxis protein CheD [Rhodoferax sp.]|nr:chemotaxis protein CheD [Rhodoferax sp.]